MCNNKEMKIVNVLAISIIMTSCATLSKTECQIADWYQIGLNDGRYGYDWSRLASHTKACAKVNITPNQTLWEQGRQEGLLSYCTVNNAYRIGLKGSYINQVCPTALAQELGQANLYGRRVNQLYKEKEQKQTEIKTLQEQLNRLRNGDNLDFKNEKEARTYMLNLPSKINALQQSILKIQDEIRAIERLNLNQ